MELSHKIIIELDTLEKDLKKRINEFIKENGITPDITISFTSHFTMDAIEPIHTETIVNASVVVGSNYRSTSLKYNPDEYNSDFSDVKKTLNFKVFITLFHYLIQIPIRYFRCKNIQ